MKRTCILMTILLLTGALFMPNSGAAAVTDGIYSLSAVSATWDATYANRAMAPVPAPAGSSYLYDYDHTYGDESSITSTLPWPFTFYGQTYSQITADSNGNIWFTATGSAHSFNLASTNRGPVIAAWNNDLSSYYYGGVFVQHKTDSNSDRVVIEWQTETYTEEGELRNNNFQVVLFSNGKIAINYKSFDTSTGKDSGSGISAGNGTYSLSLTGAFGNVFNLQNSSYLFQLSQLMPVAAFNAAPIAGGTPLIATFTDQSLRAASWLWDFGDGVTSTEQNTTHVYKTQDTYTVTLKASNSYSSATAQQTINVSACQNQPVMIQGDIPKYYPSLASALLDVADNQTIQLQVWNFAEGATISKSITLDGGYDCDFIKKNGRSVLEGDFRLSGGAVRMKDIHIAGTTPSTLPVASVSPSSDSFGSIIINSTSGEHSFIIVNTGGANLAIGAISLSGADSGEFAITSNGCENRALTPGTSCAVRVIFAPTTTGAKSAALTIVTNVAANPTVSIPLNGIGRLPNITVTKSGTGTGTVTSNPSGISCGPSCNSSNSPFALGTVSLSAAADSNSTFAGWSGGGCNGTGDCNLNLTTDTQMTAAFNLLSVSSDFSATPLAGYDPLLVVFTNLSQHATSWTWNFGDGSTSSEFSPDHVYRTPQVSPPYTVTLTATNAAGSANSTKTITVNACTTLPVKIKETGLYYPNLTNALYDALQAVEDNLSIQLQDRTFTEDAVISKTIILEGGFNCDYSSKTGKTILKGNYHINAGTVTMKDIHVAQ